MIEVLSLSGEPRFGTVSGVNDSAATLYLGRERYPVARAALEPMWTRRYLVLWRPHSPGACFVRVPRATMCCGCGSSSERWTGPGGVRERTCLR